LFVFLKKGRSPYAPPIRLSTITAATITSYTCTSITTSTNS
jgi:hypothetical protein